MENRKIINGEKLSDCLHSICINLAQQLLKRQFPKVNGPQSTLQAKKRVAKPPKNQLQIFHSCGDHSIAASTVGCKGSEVLVYNSVYCTLDKGTTDVLANLFSSSAVKMMDYQKQEGGTDCGLFAIATATAIAPLHSWSLNKPQ